MKYSPKRIATYLANKKRTLYLSVFAGAVFLVFIGVSLHGSITNSAENVARLYQTAVRVSSDEQLNYAIDTQQGRVLAPVSIKPVDLVKFSEMNKEFSYVEKQEETYTKHYRQDCTTDAEGNTKCETEEYYTWDTTGTWTVQANQVEVAGRVYPFSLFSLSPTGVPASDIIESETDKYVYVKKRSWTGFGWGASEGDRRYSYRVVNLPRSGTVFLNLSDGVKPVFGNKIDLKSEEPEQVVKQAQRGVQIKSFVFSFVWTILVFSATGLGLYYVWNNY